MDTHKLDQQREIGRAIKAYRSKYHLTQYALALKLGISHMQIMRWENAKTLPNRLSMRALQELKIIPPPLSAHNKGVMRSYSLI